MLSQPIVLTNGVFDILHRGHVTYLAEARTQGASLLVAVNTDASVKRLAKAIDRPINSCEDRMTVLAALEFISLVVSFTEDTALEIVHVVHPQIYVKGGDYDISKTLEGQAVKHYGGKLITISFKHICSTSALLKKIFT